MASLAAMPANSEYETENQNEAKPILIDTPVAFKFMMLNVLGHDFMHDFLLNTTRTAKNKKIISSISTTIRRVKDAFEENNLEKYEIIFIDDGSSDKSVEIIKSFILIDYPIECRSFTRNFGHQEALTAGLKFATKNTFD